MNKQGIRCRALQSDERTNDEYDERALQSNKRTALGETARWHYCSSRALFLSQARGTERMWGVCDRRSNWIASQDKAGWQEQDMTGQG